MDIFLLFHFGNTIRNYKGEKKKQFPHTRLINFLLGWQRPMLLRVVQNEGHYILHPYILMLHLYKNMNFQFTFGLSEIYILNYVFEYKIY